MENKEIQLTSDIDHEEIEIIGINTICRFCASQNERLIGVYSEEGVSNDLATKINLYLPVKVSLSDELPLQCCWNCASTILAWHELVLTCVESDRKFRNSQFITEKQIIGDVGYDNAGNGPSDDNDGFEAAGNGDLVVQEIIVKTSETRTCEICEKTLSSRANYTHHVKTHVSDYACSVCCNSYNTKFKLDAHFSTHSDSDNVTANRVRCDFDGCARLFRSKLQLYRHKRAHSNRPEFECDVCRVTFTKETALKNHHRTRHDNSLACDICDKSFANAKTLKEHERLHTGETPYECQQCHKKFRCRSGLKYHQVTHSTERKYKCYECGAGFMRSNYLKEHFRTHSNERPYRCRYCAAKFIQLNILKRHENRLHKRCEICQQLIGSTKEVQQHLKSKHNLR